MEIGECIGFYRFVVPTINYRNPGAASCYEKGEFNFIGETYLGGSACRSTSCATPSVLARAAKHPHESTAGVCYNPAMVHTGSPPIGIIGGMSWESTSHYYQEINRRYHQRLGGHHSAPIVLYSVDFAPIEAMQRADDWHGLAEILVDAAGRLERAGADVLLLATNTMHLVFDELTSRTTAPWIHIADPAGAALHRDGYRRVGLLGTRFTMERPFYRDRLSERYGLDIVVPDAAERAEVDRVIFEELVHGVIRDESRAYYQRVIRRLGEEGAEAVILGCTEIGLLVDAAASPVAAYDTTALHAAAAVEWVSSLQNATKEGRL